MVIINEILNQFKTNLFYGGIKDLHHRNSELGYVFNFLKLPQPTYIDVENIDTNTKNIFYPIINLSEIVSDGVDDVFGETLRNLISKFNINVVIFNMNETHRDDEFAFLHQYSLEYNIPQKNIFIIHNNINLKKYKNKYNSDINIYTPHYLLMEHSNILQRNVVNFSDASKKFLFMCHNKKMHEHRLLCLSFLQNNNLLHAVDYSCLYHYKDMNLDIFKNIFDLNLINKLKFDLEYFLNTHNKKSYFENEYVADELDSSIIETNTFKESYVNIVTETDFLYDMIHPTEKSLKPFYYFQYPIFVAPYGHIKYLKETYGFDFFDDIIDHSYDNEVDNSKRFMMVMGEIVKMYNNKDFFIKNYISFKDRFEKNQNIVKDIINNNEDYNYFKTIFYGN